MRLPRWRSWKSFPKRRFSQLPTNSPIPSTGFKKQTPMKLHSLTIMAGTAVCLLAACSREQLAPEPQGRYTITAIRESGSTKTSVDEDYSLNWNAEDVIGVFNGAESTHHKLTLTDGSGTPTATFELSEGTLEEGDVFAYYPYDEQTTLKDGKIAVDLGEQTFEFDAESKDLDNFGKYFYMTGKATAEAGSTNVDVSFRNPLSAFVFNLSNNGEESLTIKSVSVGTTDDSKVFGTAGTLDLANPGASEATTKAASASASLNSVVLEIGAAIDIPVVVFPCNLSGKELVFTVTYTAGEDAEEQKISKTLAGRNLARNSFAVIRLDFGENAAVEALQKVLQEGGTYDLTCSITGNFTVTAEKPVTINLHGYTITNDPSSEGTGDTFTVNLGSDLTISGEGTVDNTSHGKAAIYNNGTVTLNGGTYTRSAENSSDNSYYVILNHGEMTINEGVNVVSSSTFSSLIHNAYYDYPSPDERHGYVEGKGSAYPLLTIDGGTFQGGNVSIKNGEGGLLEIHGGVFPDATNYNVLNGHVANISGGEFSGASSSVYTDATEVNESYHKAETTISGGTFSGSVWNASGDKEKAAISVSGGTYSVSTVNSMRLLAGALTEDADINISLKEDSSCRFAQPITFNVTKADIDLNGNNISYIDENREAIIVSKGSVTIGNGSLKAASLVSDPSLSAIKVDDGASLTLNDMSVTSSSIGINADEGATLVLNNTTITDELTISGDTKLDNELKVFSTNMTIDLNNKTLTLPRIVFMGDKASYTITGGTLEIEGTGSGLAIEGQNSELTLDGVTINAGKLEDGESAITCGNNDKPNSSGNVLNVKNSTITSNQTGINLRRGQTLVVENSIITHKWFGITQNGVYPGSSVTVKGTTKISGYATGIYLSNRAEGDRNVLVVDGATIQSEVGSPIEIKKTDLTVTGATLKSDADPTYDFNGGGAGGSGYGIVLAGYESGTGYEGYYDRTALINRNTFELKAGDGYELFVYDGSNDKVPAN